MMDGFSLAFTLYAAVLTSLLGFAAWRDVATRTIPDEISIALIVLGIVVRFHEGWSSLGASLLVSVCLFVALLPLCSRGILGGADLKLLSALAVGLPPHVSLQLILTVTAIGGVLASVYLATGKLLARRASKSSSRVHATTRLGRVVSIEFWRIRRGAPLPYGIAIAIGAVIVVLQQQGV